jgi:hypothetical protein
MKSKSYEASISGILVKISDFATKPGPAITRRNPPFSNHAEISLAPAANDGHNIRIKCGDYAEIYP